MIQLRDVDRIPDWRWGRRTLKEMARGDSSHSFRIVEIGDLAVAGLVYRSFLSLPWFWLALSEDFFRVPLAGTRELLRMSTALPACQTLVEDVEDAMLERFAGLFHFEFIGETHGNYLVLRRA